MRTATTAHAGSRGTSDGALLVGVDVGGTHTDIVAVDDGGALVWAGKVPSNPRAPIEAIRQALRGVPASTPIGMCVNGTTIGINALLQHELPPVLLVATRGFGDMLYVRRETKANIYDLDWRKPKPLVTRDRTFEIEGRMDAQGVEVVPLGDLSPLASWITEQGVDAIAVCLLHAYRNPAHEQAVRDALQADRPDLRLTLSSDVWPEWREFERTYNTVLNAALKPVIEEYLDGLVAAVGETTGHENVFLMHADGGVLRPQEIAKRPVLTLLSGTVAGALLGGRAAQQAGFTSAVSLDMGGTSTDLSAAEHGEPSRSSELSIEWEGTLGFSGVDVVSIGSGGGSIVWCDEAGGLHVGPTSAGADPGPAAGGREGADQPTLTDAYLLLGYLGPAPEIGGRQLDPELARAAFGSLVERTGLDEHQLLTGVYAISTASLAAGVRQVTIERGIDPRECALVCFGGAGPLHAACLITEIGLRASVIPPRPGNGSAMGLLLAPTKGGASRTHYAPLSELPDDAFWGVVEDLRERALGALPSTRDAKLEWSLALRYRGQTRELSITVSDEELGKLAGATRVRVVEAFHARHEREFTFSSSGEPIQLVSMRCEASLPAHLWERFGAFDAVNAAPARGREAFELLLGAASRFERALAAVVDRDALAPGEVVAGPAIVRDVGSTILVPPGFHGRVDDVRNFLLTEVSA